MKYATLALKRFIPAWAGNRDLCPEPAGLGAVHPRVGGEQQPPRAHIPGQRGSSPRGRGTAPRRSMLMPLPRFIPAWAGNSVRLWDYIPRVSVHPRVGGEQRRGA